MIKQIGKWIRNFILFFLFSSVGAVILYRFIPVPFTPLMIIRLFEQASDGMPLSLNKDWVSYEEINPSMPLAVVASEDQQFYYHFGIDPEAIQKALEYNEKKKGKRFRGASTISQQTAKNVFLWPSRTYLRKGLEVYFTLLVELFWSKERILEVYLNVVETGNGIYGVEAASQTYFRKPASKLNRSQSALIATALPLPLKRRADRPTPYMVRRKAWVLRQMNNLGKIDWKKESDKPGSGK